MSIQIGKYTISQEDQRNLKVVTFVTKTIENAMILDSMNDRLWSDMSFDGSGDRSEYDEIKWEMGDEYQKEEFVGFFPTSKPEMAFERVYKLMVADGMSKESDVVDVSFLLDVVLACRDEVVSAVKLRI